MYGLGAYLSDEKSAAQYNLIRHHHCIDGLEQRFALRATGFSSYLQAVVENPKHPLRGFVPDL
ncbi:MAG: hypothetical protein LBK41_04965 [Clostridiales bacterium]|jgi:hypothetical protein|nr:hypothetical protein [Clostridiales bacterium]